MTVILNMKIGTIPYGLMRVKHKRRPKVGDLVLVRAKDAEQYAPWMRVMIDHYNDDGHCFASRM
jgi:hypothetical protein